MNWPFYQYIIISLILKSIWTDISIATPVLLSLLFAWNIFYHCFTFNIFVSLNSKWVFCRYYISGSCFFKIHSANLCLLMVSLIFLTFKVMTDKKAITSIICYCFLQVSYTFCSPNTVFCVWLCLSCFLKCTILIPSSVLFSVYILIIFCGYSGD